MASQANDIYWGLIAYTPTGFAWAFGSHERLELVNERLDMIDNGINPSRLFIPRFDRKLDQQDIDCLIDHMNRLDKVFDKYLP